MSLHVEHCSAPRFSDPMQTGRRRTLQTYITAHATEDTSRKIRELNAQLLRRGRASAALDTVQLTDSPVRPCSRKAVELTSRRERGIKHISKLRIVVAQKHTRLPHRT